MRTGFPPFDGTLLPPEENTLPVEVQQAIDMESFRIGQTGSGGIDLRSGNKPLDPQEMRPDGLREEVYEPLSEIIRVLNERVRLSFDIKVNDAIEDIIDRNFKLYKRITEDENFGEALEDALFREYLNRQLLDLN